VFGVNGWEVILLAVIAVLVLGPDKLPEYAAKLARGIRKARVMAEGAKEQLKDQLGPEYEDINWRQYDPRQYDPRRIVKEALLEPIDDAVAPVRGEIDSVRAVARTNGNGRGVSAGAAAGAVAGGAVANGAAGAAAMAAVDTEPVAAPATAPTRRSPQEFDASRPTPFDADAT
jgi:sec-independent protein translocase protein TatB